MEELPQAELESSAAAAAVAVAVAVALPREAGPVSAPKLLEWEGELAVLVVVAEVGRDQPICH